MNETPVARQILAVIVGLLLLAIAAAPAVSADSHLDPSTYSVAPEGGSEIYPFGDATFKGSLAEAALDSPITGITAHPFSAGYWIITKTGDVHPYGAAADYGDVSDLVLAAPIVDITATPTGNGYWLTASDGGVFSFGDATYVGSAGNIALAKPIVSMVSTPTGDGYWLAASDGGVFSFGDARFHGSAGNIALHRPVTAMAATPTGRGYWLFADDGGVFAFGDAGFHGSLAGTLSGEVIVDAATSGDGQGYWLVGNLGTVAAFGGATDFGGVAAAPDEPIAAIAATPTGAGYWLVSTPGDLAFGPPIPADSGSGRRIVYSNGGQRVWLIDDGERVVTSHLVFRQGRFAKDRSIRGVLEVTTCLRGPRWHHDGVHGAVRVGTHAGHRISLPSPSTPTARPCRLRSSLVRTGALAASGSDSIRPSSSTAGPTPELR